MPASTFRPNEVVFLQERIPRWEEMKKKPVSQKNVDQLLNERTQFIRKVCGDLLAKFPDRDPSVSDPGPVTFSEEAVAKLPQTVRQWFRNNTRPRGGKAIIEKQSVRRQTHARNLATQKFKQQIKELAREIRAEEPDMNQMTAFNKATMAFMEQLKNEDPNEYEKLHSDAVELRGAAAMDYADMSPEVLKRLLSKFPQTFMDEIEEHGRNLPVHIWSIVALAVPPAQEIKLYTMSTRSIDKILDHSSNKQMKDEFTKWLRGNLGLHAPGQVMNAVETIYPDLRGHLRPRLPSVKNIGSISAHRLRAWLRTYFNYLGMWQGAHGSVPWKALSQDANKDCIDRSRFPPGIRVLRAPSDMTRSELEAWYRWLILGQECKLSDDQVFQFAVLQRGKGLSPLIYTALQRSAPAESQLKWTADEKQYAYKIQIEAEQALSQPSWLGLPLARLYCVYEPFSPRARQFMSDGLAAEYKAKQLVDLVFQIEKHGPVHTVDAQCTEPLILYLDPEMTDDGLRELIFGLALRPAALLEDDPEYADYALSTFVRWAKTTVRLRHSLSGTWRAGPNGVRSILAIYFHFAVTFNIYKDYPTQLSTDRIKALDACNFQRLRASLISFADWFIESLQSSIRVLKSSVTERAQGWKEAVVSAGLAEPDDNIGNESVSLDTHGIPRGRATLRECYERLQQQDPDITVGEDNLEFSQARRRAHRRALALFDDDESELSDRDSLSAENIELPSDDSEDDQDTESDFGDTSPENERSDAHEATVLMEKELDNSLIAVLAHRTSDTTAETDRDPNIGSLAELTIAVNDETPEPSWSFGKSQAVPSDDDELVSGPLLNDLSPVKLTQRDVPARSPRKWRMEVVIPTPRKAASGGGRTNVEHSEATPSEADGSEEGTSSDPGDILEGSLAARRPKRSIQRSKRAEDAIRSASKGRYNPT